MFDQAYLSEVCSFPSLANGFRFVGAPAGPTPAGGGPAMTNGLLPLADDVGATTLGFGWEDAPTCGANSAAAGTTDAVGTLPPGSGIEITELGPPEVKNIW